MATDCSLERDIYNQGSSRLIMAMDKDILTMDNVVDFMLKRTISLVLCWVPILCQSECKLK